MTSLQESAQLNTLQPPELPHSDGETVTREPDIGANASNWLPSSKMVQDVLSDNPERQLEGIKQIRKALEAEPKDNDIVESGVIPQFTNFLRGSNTDLQREAALAFGKIAEGSIASSDLVIQANAPVELIKLLSNPGAQEEAARALGDVAAGYPAGRDHILEAGGLLPLLGLVEESRSVTIMRSAAIAASLLCRGKDPPPDWALASPALPVMVKLVKYDADEEALNAALWAVYSLSRWSANGIQTTIDSGVIPQLVRCLTHSTPKVQELAAYAIGNIAMGNEVQTQTLITAGALPAFRNLLSCKTNPNRKTICWIISNILHDSSTFVQAAIEAQLIPLLIDTFRLATGRLKEESSWAISKAVWGGLKLNPSQIHYMVDQGCIQPLCETLMSTDDRLLRAALGGIENVIKVGRMDSDMANQSANRYTSSVEVSGGIPRIHRLSYHSDSLISRTATFIIAEFSNDDS